MIMKERLIKFMHKKEKKSDFSSFFIHATKEQKEKVLRDVIHKANEDQRRAMDEYNRVLAKTI